MCDTITHSFNSQVTNTLTHYWMFSWSSSTHIPFSPAASLTETLILSWHPHFCLHRLASPRGFHVKTVYTYFVFKIYCPMSSIILITLYSLTFNSYFLVRIPDHVSYSYKTDDAAAVFEYGCRYEHSTSIYVCYNYWLFGHCPLSCFYLKQRFGERTLTPSSGGYNW
jgi:hypothetical protein